MNAAGCGWFAGLWQPPVWRRVRRGEAAAIASHLAPGDGCGRPSGGRAPTEGARACVPRQLAAARLAVAYCACARPDMLDGSRPGQAASVGVLRRSAPPHQPLRFANELRPPAARPWRLRPDWHLGVGVVGSVADSAPRTCITRQTSTSPRGRAVLRVPPRE